MLTTSRRYAPHARFAGRNRLALAVSAALEQAGGMVLSPVVVVAVCSLLTPDVTGMVVPAVAAVVAWIAGYVITPALLSRAGRRLPWAIGASIVRAASLALLAYVLAGDNVSRDQRLRSILICVAAYALAAGSARATSEALTARVTTARRPRRSDRLLAVLPAALALLVGLGGFSVLVDVPRSPLPRLSALVGVAAALSGAAILFLGRIVESPNPTVAERRSASASHGWRRRAQPVAWLAVSAASGAAELLLVVGLVRYVELPRAYLLSGIGAFLTASALAACVGAWVERAIPLRAFTQVSAALSGVAFALAIGLPTLLETEQAPDQLFGRQPAEVGVWVAMGLVGIAQQARRRVLPRLVDQTSTSPASLNVAGITLAFLPLVAAELFQRTEPRYWLLVGLGAALLGVVVGGVIAPRRATGSASRPALVPDRSGPVVRPVGGGYSP